MKQTTIYQLTEDDFLQAINKATKENSINNLIGYFPELVESRTVTDILGIHSNTLTKLVKNKILNPVNVDSSKYKFRLSEVLIYKLSLRKCTT